MSEPIVEDGEEILESMNLKESGESPVEEPIAGDIIPDISDPKWCEYVLTLLEDDEMVDGNPKTDGLRRIVPKVLGPIISSKPTQVFPPSFQNNNHAVVVWEVVIKFDEGDLRVFGDVADVSP